MTAKLILPAGSLRSVTEFQRNIQELPGDSRPSGAETIVAIRKGKKDPEEGRMIPLEEAAAKLRAKHGFR